MSLLSLLLADVPNIPSAIRDLIEAVLDVRLELERRSHHAIEAALQRLDRALDDALDARRDAPREPAE